MQPKAEARLYLTMPIMALTLCIFALTSCATKKPVLYKPDGSPLSIAEYDKSAQKEREAGRYENAIAVYAAIIEHHSENSAAFLWAQYETGFCYYKLGKYDEAEVYFRRVINEFQDPSARKLSQDMLQKIVEKREIKEKRKKKWSPRQGGSTPEAASS